MSRQEGEKSSVPKKNRAAVSRRTPLIAPPPQNLYPQDREDWLLRHIPTHRGLVEDLRVIENNREPKTRLDAVIVPTSYTPTSLVDSARVAHLAQSPIIYLCSGDATVRGIFDYLKEREVDTNHITAIQLPKSYKLPGLQLDTDTLPVPGYPKERDLATKRNVGLALARMAGLKTVLFLDDDIQSMEQPQLNHMLLGFDNPERQVVGWSYGSSSEGYPLDSDNSQVVQIYRMIDGEVETFIGGGTVAIRLTNDTAFFPNIYNEDWLFYAAMMRHGKSAVARAGDLIHSSRDIFDYKGGEIAVEEEFGDTFAEGLLRTQHFDRSLKKPSYLSEQWWSFIDSARKAFITKLQEEFPSNRHIANRHLHRILAASFALHDDTWPHQLSNYMKVWLSDLDTWEKWYNNLPSFASISDALHYLGLDINK